jgi:hypothetical protein
MTENSKQIPRPMPENVQSMQSMSQVQIAKIAIRGRMYL